MIPALVVLAAFLIEGSMDAWSGLYLRGQLGATVAVAAGVFIAFASAMFFGRIFASRILFGFGRRTTIVVAGAGSLVGASIATAAPGPLVAAIGFVVLGFSLSAAAPAAFGLAGDAGGDPVHAISAVTTVGYTGFVWSPALVGWVAQAFSLRAAMGVIAIATLGIVAGGVLAPHGADPNPKRRGSGVRCSRGSVRSGRRDRSSSRDRRARPGQEYAPSAPSSPGSPRCSTPAPGR